MDLNERMLSVLERQIDNELPRGVKIIFTLIVSFAMLVTLIINTSPQLNTIASAYARGYEKRLDNELKNNVIFDKFLGDIDAKFLAYEERLKHLEEFSHKPQ